MNNKYLLKNTRINNHHRCKAHHFKQHTHTTLQTYISKLRLEDADELRMPSAVAVAGQLCELLDLLLVGGDAGVLDLAAAPPGDISQTGTGLLVAQVKDVAQ